MLRALTIPKSHNMKSLLPNYGYSISSSQKHRLKVCSILNSYLSVTCCNSSNVNGDKSFDKISQSPEIDFNIPVESDCCGELCNICVWQKYATDVMHNCENSKEKLTEILNLIKDDTVREFVKFELKKQEKLHKDCEE